MIELPKEPWNPQDWETEPTATVTIATGWEYEGVQMTAEELADLAERATWAACHLRGIRYRWRAGRYDLMTNVNPNRQLEPHVPTRWRMEVGLATPFEEAMRVHFIDGMREELARTTDILLHGWKGAKQEFAS